MKNLLNITVFASAVLSIFSTSLTLYEAPDIKEALSAKDKAQEVRISSSSTEKKRIFISHDVSNPDKERSAHLLAANESEKFQSHEEEPIKVFGVKLPAKNTRSNI